MLLGDGPIYTEEFAIIISNYQQIDASQPLAAPTLSLMMAQRFPGDFDGIVSVVPVANYVGSNLMRAKLAQLQRQGGWINPVKVKLIQDAVEAACDKLDGIEDGVVSAYEKCLSTFDVGTLRCLNGPDTSDTCLSDKQIEADRLVHRPYQYPFAMKNWVSAFPGWTYGSETQPGGMIDTITGKETPHFPITNEKTQSVAWVNADGFVRYFFARDPNFDPLQFSPEKFADRIKEISEMFDTTDPDLSAFQTHGGKLILKGNAADYQRSVLQEIDYYKSVVGKMGQDRVDQFTRLYVTPGVKSISRLDLPYVTIGVRAGRSNNGAKCTREAGNAVAVAHLAAARVPKSSAAGTQAPRFSEG
jgi:hypothetical protein